MLKTALFFFYKYKYFVLSFYLISFHNKFSKLHFYFYLYFLYTIGMEGSSKIKRGKSFTIAEDMTLCKAWCHISEDPIVGNSQSYTHFWGRIYENYCSLQNDQSRTQVFIQSRWGIIMKCSNKFHGCLA